MKNNSIDSCFRNVGIVFMSVLVVSGLSGCGGQPEQRTFRGSPTGEIRVSKEELRQSLDAYEELASNIVRETTEKIDAEQRDFRIRKMNLIQGTRLKQAFSTMIELDEPIVALIETWGLTVRLRDYLATGEGGELFGQDQPLMVEMAQRLQYEVEKVAQSAFAPDIFADTKRKVEAFASANPIKGTFSNVIVYATEVTPGKPGAFSGVLGIPMAPFKIAAGVDRAALGVYNLSITADRATDVLEDLPESARWHLLLLLMEMEETNMVKTLLSSWSEISANSTRFADSFQNLPAEIRKQVSALLEEVDSRQTNFQSTLDKTVQTSTSIEKALAQVDKTASSFEQAVNSIAGASSAWEKAADATGNLLAAAEGFKPAPRDPNLPPPKPFDIDDYKDAVAAVGRSAAELNLLAGNVESLMESGQAYDIGARTINLIALRLAELFALIFVLAVIYRLIATRIITKSQ